MKVLLKDSFIEIKNTYKRFLSILLIVLLGVGFFAGMKATGPDMKKTLDMYYDEENVMDIQVVSTLGLTDEDIQEISSIDGIKKAVGSYSQDAIISLEDKDIVVKMHSLIQEEQVNELTLIDGTFPQNINECVVEESFILSTKYKIGDSINIIVESSEDDEYLKESNVKIVGVVSSPMYISMERGSTKLASGKINFFMYIPKENINSSVYTECYITLNGTKEFSCYDDKYQVIVDNVKYKIEEIEEARKEARYNSVITEANNKILDAQTQFDEEKKTAEEKISDASKQLEEAKKQIESSENEIINNEKEANSQFYLAQQKIDSGWEELSQKEQEFEKAKEEANKQIADASSNLETLYKSKDSVENGILALNDNKSKLNDSKNNISENISLIEEKLKVEMDPILIQQLQYQLSVLNNNLDTVNNNISLINSNIQDLDKNLADINAGITIINTAITKANNELENGKNAIESGKANLKSSQQQLNLNKSSTFTKLNDAKTEIKEARDTLQENTLKFEEQKKSAQDKLEKAQIDIDDAKEKIKEIKKPDWYILDRNSNTGYVQYSQDTDRISNLAQVFPLVFFIVAALISLTSMTRMVEEQRGEIGTLKALGYSKLSIARKYIIYALIATLVGSIIGIIIGFATLPKIIFNMYAMMYTLPPLVGGFNVEYALVGVILACLCTVGATIFSCTKELASTPAYLMRPKSPKAGKRVLLERIPFIWSHLKFTQKVTVRNIFRYKKRFLMTIIGIMGCSALIVTGFGIRDSISYMIPYQYQRIFKYDLQTTLKDGISTDELNSTIQKVIDNENLKQNINVNMQAVEVLEKNNTQDIQMVVPKDITKLNDFILLDNRINNQPYLLDDTGVIITEKLAKLLNIKVGDEIMLKNSDDETGMVRVAKITENYLMHYIYISPTLYKQVFNEVPRYNVILSIANELTSEQENEISSELLKNDNISSAYFTTATSKYFDDVMSNMSFVVWILIVCAGLLAFVVLYNLSNVNISERIRELATIKVLGFYDKEVYNYTAKETVILTIIGMLLGLVGGYFLNMFILKTCELDILMFVQRVNITSYIYSVLITSFFSIIVSIATYFTLKKIDMIESLKSIE